MFINIWVDCVKRLSLKEKNENKALKEALFIMSFLMSFNFFIFMMIIQGSLDNFFYTINFTYFSGFANYILMLVFLYFFPMYIFNSIYLYFKIEKIKLCLKSSRVNGKYIIIYTIISMFGPVILFYAVWLIGAFY